MVTQNVYRTHEGKHVFFRFLNALDLNKCLKQIKEPRSLHTYAPNAELPTNINTMASTGFCQDFNLRI